MQVMDRVLVNVLESVMDDDGRLDRLEHSVEHLEERAEASSQTQQTILVDLATVNATCSALLEEFRAYRESSGKAIEVCRIAIQRVTEPAFAKWAVLGLVILSLVVGVGSWTVQGFGVSVSTQDAAAPPPPSGLVDDGSI